MCVLVGADKLQVLGKAIILWVLISADELKVCVFEEWGVRQGMNIKDGPKA